MRDDRWRPKDSRGRNDPWPVTVMVFIFKYTVMPLLWILMLVMYPFFYLLCRLQAKKCPYCNEKWFTELIGEWDGETWRCWRCGKYWDIPYVKAKK